ncbi:hypothetical protein DUNSADRAFT_5401 [Dunaliella salina]|uniref:Secreted protein n=1 Tax=Dunaliella salina TaxID=3046 RepID=A0ABQ7GQ83_DUNSA|nr:hypothetical protein DUNSADRAFT_5401 [Dunaliella salina]|eukprot:KAF5836774.1 hypothetical protein DUNSADRAFT_5401 [Dunaliella salina]
MWTLWGLNALRGWCQPHTNSSPAGQSMTHLQQSGAAQTRHADTDCLESVRCISICVLTSNKPKTWSLLLPQVTHSTGLSSKKHGLHGEAHWRVSCHKPKSTRQSHSFAACGALSSHYIWRMKATWTPLVHPWYKRRSF